MCSESDCPIARATGSALDGINSAASGDESQSKEEMQYGDEEKAGAEITRYVDFSLGNWGPNVYVSILFVCES